VFVSKPTKAFAQDYSEQIHDYSVQLTANADGTLTVAEIISYDFGALQRHGIYRDIPVRYKTDSGNNTSIKVDNIRITSSDFNTPIPFTTEQS
jgi:hypothetical protein